MARIFVAGLAVCCAGTACSTSIPQTGAEHQNLPTSGRVLISTSRTATQAPSTGPRPHRSSLAPLPAPTSPVPPPAITPYSPPPSPTSAGPGRTSAPSPSMSTPAWGGGVVVIIPRQRKTSESCTAIDFRFENRTSATVKNASVVFAGIWKGYQSEDPHTE